MYPGPVPKLWTETMDAHRRAVRDATLDATAALVAERGLASVTMSEIAERTGIGRATLYKYFPDVQSILTAWHERLIADHLERLTAVARDEDDPRARLSAVLEHYALLQRGGQHHHGSELAALLHGGDHVVRARQHLHAFVRDRLAAAVQAGQVRRDVPVDELATYCLHALTAAAGCTSRAAIRRLVEVTLDGLRPAAPPR
jgi:AcrR family transcriptional regulator